MKIAAWNLNHRIVEKPIPPGVLDVVRGLAPDVLVLNEYVDGDGRTEFKAALTGLGLAHITVSKRLPKHNHVLVASRAPQLSGTLSPPDIDTHAETNFHSVHIGAIEIAGMRVPAYESRELTERYWRELYGGMRSARQRAVLLIGDMNGDPENPRSPGGVRMAKWREDGWVIPVADGAWSFPVRRGAAGSRIDHVIANESVGIVVASYVTRVGEHVLAGGPPGVALSDHAALVAEVKSFDEAGVRKEPPYSELILHVSAEGGGLDLVGCRRGEGWVFRGAVRDWTPELFGETWVEHESASVATWAEALELLDQYPWHRLSPTFVHPEFRQAIYEAVVERYRDGSAHSTLGKWKLLCGTLEVGANLAMRPTEEHESIGWLIGAIKRLPSDAHVPAGSPGYNNYNTQKDHWLGWLDQSAGTGTFPRKIGADIDARYVYNHIRESLMLLWLIEAADVKAEMRSAARQAANSAPLLGRCAAIRKLVPWSEVESALLGRGQASV